MIRNKGRVEYFVPPGDYGKEVFFWLVQGKTDC
jgi:hypothetical protein